MYSFVHEGVTYEVCILDTYSDYLRLTYKDKNCVYYITKLRAFVLNNFVFAKGNLRNVWSIDPVHIMDYVESDTKPQIDMNNRRKFETSQNSVSKEEKPKSFDMEIEKMGFKTADNSETVLELSVPTVDELDSYFSSIGLEIPGGNF